MMKKLILSLTVVAVSFASQSQVVVAGVSPAAIQGNYDYTHQANEDGWPGETDDGTWALALDFNIPGTFVQDTLMMVEDGTPGLNPQGNPISQEGCDTLINDLTGKIAVIYRNTCEFGTKALMAQNAGAVAVIIVNREDALLGMLGGVDGFQVTIPVVFLSSVDGGALISEMSNGPVVVLIGNKYTAYANDIGSNPDEMLISSYGGQNSMIDNGFDLGIQLYNYGTNTQSNVTVTANIDGPSGNVYNEVITGPTMNTFDTLSIFNGNTYEFTPFDLGGIGNYPAGDYTLTYTLDIGVPDDAAYDNVYTSTFTVNPTVVSLSSIDATMTPIANSYPSNSEGEYQSCMFFVDPNASNMGLGGIHFTPHMDTAAQLVGEEIFLNVYQWDDAWVDLADPNFGLATNDFFQNLNVIAFETYYPASAAENDVSQYIPLAAPFLFVDNQRYLVCAQTFNPNVSFGYDSGLNYDGNQGISAMPISPVGVEIAGVLTWYTGGWNSSSASSIGLEVVDAASIGLNEEVTLAGKAYPNPAVDNVTIEVEANGSAELTITDARGVIASTGNITLENGKSNINISALEPGVYIFNVTLEDGQTSHFSVVKK